MIANVILDYDALNVFHMAYKAKIWKKIRRWVGKRLELNNRSTYNRNEVSAQVGRLMKNRGSEIISMTNL